MIHNHNNDSLLSTMLGGFFGFLATVGSHPAFQAFCYGFIGAFGGLMAKLLWATLNKKRKDKKVKPEDPQG